MDWESRNDKRENLKGEPLNSEFRVDMMTERNESNLDFARLTLKVNEITTI